jgi:hypothetical protein
MVFSCKHDIMCDVLKISVGFQGGKQVMKKQLLALLMIMGVLLMIGCSKENEGKAIETGSNQINESPANTAAPTASLAIGAEPSESAAPAVERLEPLKPDTSYLTEEMFSNAVMAEGNLARLAAVMKKARNGEEITVGVIGAPSPRAPALRQLRIPTHTGQGMVGSKVSQYKGQLYQCRYRSHHLLSGCSSRR